MRYIKEITLACILTGCTGQVPGSFRYLQQEQSFSSMQEINTMIDLLWVVDNSSSMDVSQQKLRNGFRSFALKYLQPTWDVRVAVISTDTYMAHSAFSNYLQTTVPGSVGYVSPYIQSRLSTFENPNWNPNLVNPSTGAMDNGIRFGDLNPLWGPNYARLLAGVHDGPVTAFCFEGMPYFIRGITQCRLRDDQDRYIGTTSCLSPQTDQGESSLSECVNTVQNDTVRTGHPILSTMPPVGTPGDSQWVQRLIQNFMVNVSAGSSGQGSERGLGSLLQLIQDNENTSSSFFRKGSLRGVIFVSDEDDQSMEIPDPVPSGFLPTTGYMCDQASLVQMNGSAAITGNGGYCCNDPDKNCKYGSLGISCSTKQVEGLSYAVSICPDPSRLIPVSRVKADLDGFFRRLDGNSSGDPNYFIVSIVPLSANSIQNLQAARNDTDASLGLMKTFAVDRGDRYLELGSSVGADSLALDIGAEDYSPVLDKIGKKLIEKKSVFLLSRVPTGKEEMLVKIKHRDGSETVIPYSDFELDGKRLIFTNSALVLSFSATDQVVINYQPTTAR